MAPFVLLLISGILITSSRISAQPYAPDSIGIYLSKRNIAGAEKNFTARFSSQKNSDLYFYWSGRINFAKNKNEEALKDFEKATQLKKNVSDYHLWTGRAAGRSAQNASVFRQPGLAKQCKNEYEKAVQLDPKSIEAKNDLIGYYLQAPAIMGGSVEDASKLAAEIEKLDSWQGFFAKIRVENKRNPESGAEPLYKTALSKWPDSVQVVQQYGNFLYEKKRFDEAFELTKKAEKLKPGEWGVKYQLAKIAAVSGKFTAEILPEIKALAENPPADDLQWRAYFHFRHGQILEHRGNTSEAKAAFQKALALKSDLQDAKKALERLK